MITHKPPLIHALNVSTRRTVYLKNPMSPIFPHNMFVGVHNTRYVSHLVPVCFSHLFVLPVEEMNKQDDHNCCDTAGVDNRYWDRVNKKVYPAATINYQPFRNLFNNIKWKIIITQAWTSNHMPSKVWFEIPSWLQVQKYPTLYNGCCD